MLCVNYNSIKLEEKKEVTPGSRRGAKWWRNPLVQVLSFQDAKCHGSEEPYPLSDVPLRGHPAQPERRRHLPKLWFKLTVELDKNLCLLTSAQTSSPPLPGPLPTKRELLLANENRRGIPFSPMELTTVENSDNAKHWSGCGENRTLLCCCWECKLLEWLWRKLATPVFK